ncbi:hypothetical protein ETQ85_06450 [Zoogloea oleivorans]|uniref:Lipid A biosynthesis acyltransferase n=1 Tax=Zoogloea oleivorans TaxID=1552750 RepID=A0A6C2D2J2_9RHOO|nr:hypothetical protein [Zoogloea oleivorans]TYC60144.1 hypothetical protein ETQ85_06450 [Zoogloea oleivorans]
MKRRPLLPSAKASLRRLIEHLLIPGAGALLPWPLYFRGLSRLASNPRLLFQECAAASEGYRAIFGITPNSEWLRRYRLTILIDRADAFISATRSDRWLEKHVTITGAWPTGPFVGITFHFGAGMWSLRHIRSTGLRAAFLSIRFSLASFGNKLIPYWIARFRMHEVRQAGNAPVIYTGGSIKSIRKAFEQGICVIGLIDVPPHQAEKGRLGMTLFGRPAALPSGLLEIAATEDVPATAFLMSVDWRTGKRTLDIFPVPPGSPSEQIGFMSTLLNDAITEKPEAWHLWLCAHCFLTHQLATNALDHN